MTFRYKINNNIIIDSFVILSIIIFTGGLIHLFRQDANVDIDQVEGDIFKQIIWLAIYFITTIILVKNFRQFRKVLKSDKLILSLILLAIISVIWSVEPTVSFRRSIALLGTSLFAYLVYIRYKFNDFLHILSASFKIIITLSLITILIIPEYGIMSGIHEGSIRGIYTHKNTFGRIIALSVFLFTILYLKEKNQIKKLKTIFWISLSIVLVLLSKSAQAMILILILYYIIIIYKIHNKKNVFIYSLLLSISILLIIILFNIEIIFGLFDRDTTMTGRLPLWVTLLYFISEKPLLGYGYGAFWVGESSYAAVIWAIVKWDTPHAHNGFIDLILHTGFIGFTILIIAYVKHIRQSLIYINKSLNYQKLWPLLVLVFILISNITASVILIHNNFYWILYVLNALYLSNFMRIINNN
jgi:exopolysaccharide production protein ExoQ